MNPDMGTDDGSNTGHNTIKDNADAGADGSPYDNAGFYDILNNSNTTIKAENNWWSTSPPITDSGSPIHIKNQDGGAADITDANPYNAQSLNFSINPATGDEGGGTTVTITALTVSSEPTFFVENVGATVDNNNISVTIDGNTVAVTFNSNTSLSVTTPADSPGTADVVVTNPAGQTGTLSSAYTYTDTTAPTVSSFSPVDNATGVAIGANLVITFNENVDTETGNITIKKTSGDSTVETIDVTGGQVTGSGTSTITINPSSDFADETGYYVLIDATAFDDTAGNSYAGISSKTVWNFTTAAAIPTLSELGMLLFVVLLLFSGIYLIIHRRVRGVR